MLFSKKFQAGFPRNIICVITLYIGGFFIGKFYSLITFEAIKPWQDLVGALIGASLGIAAPISLYFIQDSINRKEKFKDLILLLEKNITLAINNLSSIDKMLHHFVTSTLGDAKKQVQTEASLGKRSIKYIFIPLSYAFSFEKDLIRHCTGSNYIENLMLETMLMSQELPHLLQDIDRQLSKTLDLNSSLILSQGASAEQSIAFLNGLNKLETMIRTQLFEHNIPIYLRKLAAASISIHKLGELGISIWKETFVLPAYMSTEDRIAQMENYFKPEIDNLIASLGQKFNSKLLFIGEMSNLEKS